ncbi:MAG: hypothetical protein RJA70_977 [Pseudomonadota bacterium]|jgi:leucyl aminopeptidase
MLDQLSPRRTASSVPLTLIQGKKPLAQWVAAQPQHVKKWVTSTGYNAASGTSCVIPNRDGSIRGVLLSVDSLSEPWYIARLPGVLPTGRYYIVTELTPEQANAQALGWALGCYRFDRYQSKKKKKSAQAELVWPETSDQLSVSALVQAIALGRDLVNTPAQDMGPEQLAEAASKLAADFGAKARIIVGDELLKQRYPAIHAVGRACSRAPRLIDFVWGKPSDPKVTLVGKGVCFDTGGLNLKPADNMKLMKKDMGGAATVLSVAYAVMSLGFPVRLRVLIPAVENSVSGDAMRPLDVLDTRKGLTVEVGHTDAEGRLVLSDALFEADSEHPDLLIDIATLTGAARVALGTDLPALFASHDASAQALLDAGLRTQDALWRLPLHRPYRRMLDSKVADLSNVSPGAYGGAITAALFLQEFVSKDTDWMHIDTMAYNLESRPGRPTGGEVFTVRAIVEMLRERYAQVAPVT